MCSIYSNKTINYEYVVLEFKTWYCLETGLNHASNSSL